jgi:large subunit ribosomal protein L10
LDNPRPEKVAVVEEVRERLSSAQAAILTEYRGLKVKDLAVLRRSLREAGGEYRVYKNTLVRFAAADLGLTGLDALLEGPTAIAFVDGDAVQVAKALRDYARTNPALVVKGGVLGTSILDAKAATALAEMPSREVLLARIAGGLAAPLVQFAGLLQALPRNMAYGLKALIDKRVEGGEALPATEPEPEPEAPAAAEPEPETSVAEAEPEAEPEVNTADPVEGPAEEPTGGEPGEAEVNTADPVEGAPEAAPESTDSESE